MTSMTTTQENEWKNDDNNNIILLSKEITHENNKPRCITPSSLIENNDNNNQDEDDGYDYDIPHMLNPYSDESDNDNNDNIIGKQNNHDPYLDGHHHNVKISPIHQTMNGRADSPHNWNMSSGSYDMNIVNSSPVSSISNFSYDYNVVISSSNNNGGNNNVNNVTMGDLREDNNNDDNAYNTSIPIPLKQRVGEFLPSPNLVRERRVPRPKLKPRFGKLEKRKGTHNDNSNINNNSNGNGNISSHAHHIPSIGNAVQHTMPLTTVRSSSPSDSHHTSSLSHKNRRSRDEHSKKGGKESNQVSPSRNRKNRNRISHKHHGHQHNHQYMYHNNNHHRRSVSLNQLSSPHLYYNEQKRFSKGVEEYRLSPLKEGKEQSQDKLDLLPLSLSTRNHSGNDQQPIPLLSHRRTVSFPDHVFQKGSMSYGSNTSSDIYTFNRSPYSPLTSQSDDPALFSLLETTQCRRSNGRIPIPFDVEPSITSIVVKHNNNDFQHYHNSHQPLYLTSDQLLQHSIKNDVRSRSRNYKKSSGSGSLSLESLDEGEDDDDDDEEKERTRHNDVKKDMPKTPVQQLKSHESRRKSRSHDTNKKDSSFRTPTLSNKYSSKHGKKLSLPVSQLKPQSPYDKETYLETEEGIFNDDGSSNHLDKLKKNKDACIIM